MNKRRGQSDILSPTTSMAPLRKINRSATINEKSPESPEPTSIVGAMCQKCDTPQVPGFRLRSTAPSPSVSNIATMACRRKDPRMKIVHLHLQHQNIYTVYIFIYLNIYIYVYPHVLHINNLFVCLYIQRCSDTCK